MSRIFTAAERSYLTGGPRLARVATVDRHGRPHVVPTGWVFDPDSETILLRGISLERTKKYRDARETGRVALVIDHVDEPWSPVGIEIRGDAEVGSPPEPYIRLHPKRVISWGLESEKLGERFARDVGR
jgi:pyridoxamine 5'-phosphate oxidase family protein